MVFAYLLVWFFWTCGERAFMWDSEAMTTNFSAPFVLVLVLLLLLLLQLTPFWNSIRKSQSHLLNGPVSFFLAETFIRHLFFGWLVGWLIPPLFYITVFFINFYFIFCQRSFLVLPRGISEFYWSTTTSIYKWMNEWTNEWRWGGVLWWNTFIKGKLPANQKSGKPAKGSCDDEEEDNSCNSSTNSLLPHRKPVL